jgi:hypothetical protein
LDLTGVNALAFGFGRKDEALTLRRAAVGDAGVVVVEPLEEVVVVVVTVGASVLPWRDLSARKGGIG